MTPDCDHRWHGRLLPHMLDWSRNFLAKLCQIEYNHIPRYTVAFDIQYFRAINFTGALDQIGRRYWRWHCILSPQCHTILCDGHNISLWRRMELDANGWSIYSAERGDPRPASRSNFKKFTRSHMSCVLILLYHSEKIYFL